MYRITIWNENLHERQNDQVRDVYPQGIHGALARNLGSAKDFRIETATLEMPEHGLTEERLATTDVLIWWGHMAHDKVNDEIAERVRRRVLKGMGLILLHSAHLSKPFQLLLGTSGALRWRDNGERERIWNIAPAHPITRGVGEYLDLEKTEMYGERFDIPEPAELIFLSWFEGGEVMRSGCTWQRGAGRIFYFRPGHETFPIYHDRQILQIIGNAVRWAAPRKTMDLDVCVHAQTAPKAD